MFKKNPSPLRAALITFIAIVFLSSLSGCKTKPFDISGTVLDQFGDPASGVSITADTETAVTDGDGKYSIKGLTKANSLVVPSKEGYLFNPSQASVSGPSSSVNFTMVPGPKGVGISDIDMGASFSAVLDTEGRVWMCGNNEYGVLGDGTNIDRLYWVRSAGLDQVVDISAGYGHIHALRSDGTVWGWGFAGSGRLGFSSPSLAVSNPTKINGLSGIASISAGDYHSVAVGNDGKVWAWGSNEAGQLGVGDTTPRSGPVQVVALSGVSIIDACAASNFTIALSDDGKVWAWGENYYGQLGNGSTLSSSVPVQSGTLDDFVAISASSSHCLALRSNGEVWGWGSNGYGQADGKTTSNVLSPAKITISDMALGISAGSLSSFIFVPSGVYAWGANNSGQLGEGSTLPRNVPVLSQNLSSMYMIASNYSSCIAFSTSGDLYAWGNNHKGQLCTGDNITRNSPAPIVW